MFPITVLLLIPRRKNNGSGKIRRSGKKLPKAKFLRSSAARHARAYSIFNRKALGSSAVVYEYLR